MGHTGSSMLELKIVEPLDSWCVNEPLLFIFLPKHSEGQDKAMMCSQSLAEPLLNSPVNLHGSTSNWRSLIQVLSL